jgi:hypothetical protein
MALIAAPLKEQTSEEVAKAFVSNVLLIYEQLQIVLSDCGATFLSETFENMCKILGIKKSHSASFRPQAQGLTEA